jgi:hypothetical protein
VNLSGVHFDLKLPYWRDYLGLIEPLAGPDFPDCDSLNALVQNDLHTQSGKQIRFVDSDQLDEQPYEQRIFEFGQVSTRKNSWHDLFNALVWLRLPAVKSAMNARHIQAWPQSGDAGRGPARDALTLFDECGVIICTSDLAVLEGIAEHRWKDVFQQSWNDRLEGPVVCGHAMLEKFLTPYKSMTAKALLLHADCLEPEFSRASLLTLLDQAVATAITRQQVLNEPACLAPLPLAGIPGWWPVKQQRNPYFYDDPAVFRPARPGQQPAPIFRLSSLLH